MKRVLLVPMILGLVVSFTGSSRAQQIDTHCCCNVLCYYNFIATDKASPDVFTMSFDECDLVSDFGLFTAKDICEAPLYLIRFCRNRTEEAWAELEKTVIGKLATVWYYKSEGSCRAEEVECPIEYMLGGEDERLDVLRKYRDEVLSKTPVGQEIVELYYVWSPVIVKVMEEDEEFKEEIKEMLEDVLPLVRKAVE